MNISELIDPFLLQEMIETKYIKCTQHPSEDLYIYGYTNGASYDRVWNEATLQCRGLIADGFGEIVARPWPKFFNFGEAEDGGDLIISDERVEVTDKMDGSLGLLYWTSEGWKISTRGSFSSDQAIRASNIWEEKYSDFKPIEGKTYLFEIILPENRIVVDYGVKEDLVLLGFVDINTGQTYGPWDDYGWKGERAEVFAAPTFVEALAIPPRENAEGVVVRFLESGRQIKIKQADYLRLHAIMTNTNARDLWEIEAVKYCKRLITEPSHWASYLGIDPARAEQILALAEDWLEGVPDEFMNWVKDLQYKLKIAWGIDYVGSYALASKASKIPGKKERYEFINKSAYGVYAREIMAIANDYSEGDFSRNKNQDQLSLRIWRQNSLDPRTPFGEGNDA